MYIKISKLFNSNGEADYKGLDIKNIKRGSQIYPEGENTAYFEYDGEVIEGNDIQIISLAIYDEHKTRIANQPKPITQEAEIAQLKQSQVEQDELIMSLLLGGM